MNEEPNRASLQVPLTPSRGAVLAWSAGVVLVIGLLAILYVGRSLLVPIALAVLLWFLVNALARLMTRAETVRRVLPMFAAKALVIVCFVLFALFAGRTIAGGFAELGSGLEPENSVLLSQLLGLVRSAGLPADNLSELLLVLYPFDDLLAAAVDFGRGLVSDLSLVFLYVMFLLLDQRFFGVKLAKLFPDGARRAEVDAALSQIEREAEVYLRLMFVLSGGVGLATFAVCASFGLRGAAFWGFLAFILNFVPTLGSILAVALPASYALLTFSDPLALAGVILLLAAVQFVAGEVVLPRVMGDSLNLSSFVVLLAVVFWGALWGPVGMFLGIPITVSVLVLSARYAGTRPLAVLLSKDGRIPDPSPAVWPADGQAG